MAALLNTRDELIKTQCSSVRARREVDGLLNTQRKLVDTEERRKDRADVTVSITTFLGFFDMLVEVVRTHVTDPEQRAAIGKAFDLAIRRSGLPDVRLGHLRHHSPDELSDAEVRRRVAAVARWARTL